MSIPETKFGEKNLIGPILKRLREEHGVSQRELAKKFQLIGCDIDQNVIARIETDKRRVSDIEIRAIMKVFRVPSSVLLEEGPEIE